MNIIFELLRDTFPLLMHGLYFTLLVSIVSNVIGLILGLIFRLMQVSKLAILKVISTVYVDVIQGTPLLIQLLFVYFGIPMASHISMTPLIAGFIAMSINTGAYMTEIFRAGINSIDTGQTEAGRSLGLPYGKTMQLVILPQAVRQMIPPFVNQITHEIKDTSLLSVIGVAELTMTAQSIYAQNFRAFEMLFIVAMIYLIVIYLFRTLAKVLERKLSN